MRKIIPRSRAEKEGRVNVALGRYEKILAEQARRAGTTKTNLARILLVSGLEKLAAGKARITGPALAPLP